MTKWEWNKRLETGIEDIDDQHMELFRRIDKLELAMYSGMGTSELLYLIKYLESYIIEHFDLEEKLMFEADYPDLSNHRKQHNEFRITCREFFASCREKGADKYLAIEVDKQMRKWWENHILKLDLDYIPYLKGNKPDKLVL